METRESPRGETAATICVIDQNGRVLAGGPLRGEARRERGLVLGKDEQFRGNPPNLLLPSRHFQGCWKIR
jgi:hypothetical protein